MYEGYLIIPNVVLLDSLSILDCSISENLKNLLSQKATPVGFFFTVQEENVSSQTMKLVGCIECKNNSPIYCKIPLYHIKAFSFEILLKNLIQCFQDKAAKMVNQASRCG